MLWHSLSTSLFVSPSLGSWRFTDRETTGGGDSIAGPPDSLTGERQRRGEGEWNTRFSGTERAVIHLIERPLVQTGHLDPLRRLNWRVGCSVSYWRVPGTLMCEQRCTVHLCSPDKQHSYWAESSYSGSPWGPLAWLHLHFSLSTWHFPIVQRSRRHRAH